MVGSFFGILCIFSLVVSAITGNLGEVGNAVLDSASGAVKLTLSLCGIMCLWGGVMQVLTDAGAVRLLSRLAAPFLRVFFPTAWRTGIGADDIAANLGANLLGVGNAATPLALRAMAAMQSVNPDPAVASADMITLAVLNTASVSLVPSTVIALRRAAGASAPYAVVLPVWICSLTGATLALVSCRLAAIFAGRKPHRQKPGISSSENLHREKSGISSSENPRREKPGISSSENLRREKPGISSSENLHRQKPGNRRTADL